jgi:hypothetical protein
MDAQFSRDAGQVLASPYWTSPPDDVTGPELATWWEQRTSERNQLEDALAEADTYDSLPEEAKTLYDAAAEELVAASAQEDLYDRLHGAG